MSSAHRDNRLGLRSGPMSLTRAGVYFPSRSVQMGKLGSRRALLIPQGWGSATDSADVLISIRRAWRTVPKPRPTPSEVAPTLSEQNAQLPAAHASGLG